MRAFLLKTDPRLMPGLAAAALLAALCLLAASGAPAQTLREKQEATRGALDEVRQNQDAVAATIAEQNRAIDTMMGEVSRLRQRQQAAEAALEAKQAELRQATAELRAEERRLERVRDRLRRALSVLRERLVAIYETGSPDALTVVLDSESWSQANARAEYLSQIQEYDSSVAERVESLRDQARATVRKLAETRERIEAARDEIAEREREAAAASAEAGARFAELRSAQAERQAALDSLQSREAALADNLSAISEQIAGAEGDPSTSAPATEPAPLSAGETAEFISESQASVPSGAPPAVRAVIEAANSIATTPYVWGGGHGSFESSGYDCSGALSFALNGGGFLSSPLDSTGLSTWGEAGAGQWITVYANAGHAWAMIAGLAFDTAGGNGPRWHASPPSSTEGFIARHPAGY